MTGVDVEKPGFMSLMAWINVPERPKPQSHTHGLAYSLEDRVEHRQNSPLLQAPRGLAPSSNGRAGIPVTLGW